MKTLYHPTLLGVQVTVPAAAVKDWRAQGWRTTPPKAPHATA